MRAKTTPIGAVLILLALVVIVLLVVQAGGIPRSPAEGRQQAIETTEAQHLDAIRASLFLFQLGNHKVEPKGWTATPRDEGWDVVFHFLLDGQEEIATFYYRDGKSEPVNDWAQKFVAAVQKKE
jgi:hypothetical protein